MGEVLLSGQADQKAQHRAHGTCVFLGLSKVSVLRRRTKREGYGICTQGSRVDPWQKHQANSQTATSDPTVQNLADGNADWMLTCIYAEPYISLF